MQNKSKYWCFTVNNPETRPTLRLVPEDDCDYWVCGREVGEGGTPHLQGFCVMKKVATFKTMQTLLEGAHLERMKGTPQQASDYCKKGTGTPEAPVEADFDEYGVLPGPRGLAGGTAQAVKYQQAWEAAVQGEMELIPKDLLTKHYMTYKQIAEDARPTPPDNDCLTNDWYVGPTGSGKSKAARTNYPGCYIKDVSKWWPGYQDEEVVLIDDLDTSHEFMTRNLKLWSDHYPFPAERKGGHVGNIRPKRIVVTSQYEMAQIFKDPETVEALKRRFKVTRFGAILSDPGPAPARAPTYNGRKQRNGWANGEPEPQVVNYIRGYGDE